MVLSDGSWAGLSRGCVFTLNWKVNTAQKTSTHEIRLRTGCASMKYSTRV